MCLFFKRDCYSGVRQYTDEHAFVLSAPISLPPTTKKATQGVAFFGLEYFICQFFKLGANCGIGFLGLVFNLCYVVAREEFVKGKTC